MGTPWKATEWINKAGEAEGKITNAPKVHLKEGTDYVINTESVKENSHVRKETQHLFDHKSFWQSLFSTTAWKLSSIFELQNGLYRLIPTQDIQVKETTRDSILVHLEETSINNTTEHESPPSTSDVSKSTSTHSLHLWQEDNLSRVTVPEAHRALNSQGTINYLDYDLAKALQTSTRFLFKNEKYERFGIAAFDRTSPLSLSQSSFTDTDITTSTRYHDSVIRSMEYILGSARALLKCYLKQDAENGTDISGHSPITTPIHETRELFASLLQIDCHPRIVFPSLAESILEANFLTKYSTTETPHSDKTAPSRLNDSEAAHIINLCLGALIANVPLPKAAVGHDVWKIFLSSKQADRFVPHPYSYNLAVRRQILEYNDAYEDELAIQLMRMTLNTFVSRVYQASYSLPLRERGHDSVSCQPDNSPFANKIIQFLASDNGRHAGVHGEPSPYGLMVLEWARTVIHKDWDMKAEFSWASHVGSAVEFMRLLCKFPCGTVGSGTLISHR